MIVCGFQSVVRRYLIGLSQKVVYQNKMDRREYTGITKTKTGNGGVYARGKAP